MSDPEDNGGGFPPLVPPDARSFYAPQTLPDPLERAESASRLAQVAIVLAVAAICFALLSLSVFIP